MSLARNFRRALTRDSSWFADASTIPAPGGGYSSTGVPFANPGESLALPAVFKAIRGISETSGAMPLVTYRRTGDTGRDRASQHNAYALLHDAPNPDETATEAWTRAVAHLAGWGECFIGKEKAFGSVKALWPIEPSKMRVERKGGKIVYTESTGGGQREWDKRDLIHIRLFSLDGVRGISPLRLHRETTGLGLAMQQHAGQFFADAAVPSGVLTVQGRIRDNEVRDAMREEWKDRHQNNRDIAILDDGATYDAITVPMEDAQFVQLYGLTITDVANIFNMPASMLNGSAGDSMTYGNREADALQFLTFTLANPLRKFEQALSNDLDLFPQRNTFYVEFLRDSILQSTALDRARFYTFALGDSTKPGWMSRDEVRARENLTEETTTPAAPVAADPFAAVEASLEGLERELAASEGAATVSVNGNG